MAKAPKRRDHCVLLDWGDTVMRDISVYEGKMASWPIVQEMPGIRRALEDLRSTFLIALATNAADSEEEDIRQALRRVDLEIFFDHVFCARTVGFRKPAIEFFEEVLRRLQLPATSVVMVGDRLDADVAGAEAVGMPAIWFRLDPLKAAEPDRTWMIERLEDLPEMVRSLLLGSPESR